MSTICAISTPSGIGGIAVVRISGPDAISACSKVFVPHRKEHALEQRATHTLTFGQIVNPATHEVIDEVVVMLYRAPHSFTGEDVVEISCHGSQYIQQELLHLLTGQCGLRMAERGEFTRRAFANGCMDLSQAEAVADLIAAQNAAAHRLALGQMKGSVSRTLDLLRDQLLHLSTLLELELDFSEEDVTFADRTELLELARRTRNEVSRLADTFRTGQALRGGIPVAIIGETNAGKSTLLNHLLGDDRAIVSDVHGTTRDVVEDTILVEGQLVRFIDTAGIRETSDTVEHLGIERTYQRIQHSHVVLWVIDGRRLDDAERVEACAHDAVEVYRHIYPYLNEQKVIVVVNKVDLVNTARLQHHLPTFQGALSQAIQHEGLSAPTLHYIAISAKHGQGLDQLHQALVNATRLPQLAQGDVIVTNQRHYNALVEARTALTHVIDGLDSQLTADLVAEDLRQAIDALNSILGQGITSQDTLNNIFQKFCVGK